MTSHSTDFLDLHFFHAESKPWNGQSVGRGGCQIERDLVPAEVFFLVILSQLVSDRDLLDGNTTKRNPARALHKGNSGTGAVQRQREVLSANGADKIHRENVARISIHDADKNNRPGADVEGGQREKLTDNHLCFWRGRTLGNTSLLTGKIQVAPPNHASGEAPDRKTV